MQYFTVVFYSRHWSGDTAAHTEEATEIRFFAPDNLPALPPNEAPSLEWLQRFKQDGRFILA